MTVDGSGAWADILGGIAAIGAVCGCVPVTVIAGGGLIVYGFTELTPQQQQLTLDCISAGTPGGQANLIGDIICAYYAGGC